MKAIKKNIKIAVLDDSDFYNRLLSHELEAYCKMLSLEYSFDFEINSFSDIGSFFKRVDKDLDLAIVDFYLSAEINGDKVARDILKKNNRCNVVIISQSNSVITNSKSKISGATEFIHKDKYAIENVCFLLHKYVTGGFTHA